MNEQEKQEPTHPAKTDLADQSAPDDDSPLGLFELFRADGSQADGEDSDPTGNILSSRRPSVWDVR